MEDSGSSVTLVYYRLNQKWWNEPLLNIVAAAAQMSTLTHVEIAIGEEVGNNGMMSNVCRVFNDAVGVELVERTGRNPQYEYQSLGCSQAAVQKMLRFAKRECVGRPFSNTGMARSILWPRQTDRTSFFCAELVASILREGGLLEAGSNPGSATPETLYRLYHSRAACTANPHVLRDANATSSLTFATVGRSLAEAHPAVANEQSRGPFRLISSCGATAAAAYSQHSPHVPQKFVRSVGLQLTLKSLDMSK